MNLDGALRDAYTLLSGDAYKDYYRRAVFVLGNRGFDQATCGQTPRSARRRRRRRANKIQTYVLMLARDTADRRRVACPPGSNELAVMPAAREHVYDARSNKGPAQDAFQTVVNDLATCVYDVIPPRPVRMPTSTLSYSDPIDPPRRRRRSPSTGRAARSGRRRGLRPRRTNPNRVYLCKASCEAYRDVLRKASLYAAQNGQSPIAVPVFSHKAGLHRSGERRRRQRQDWRLTWVTTSGSRTEHHPDERADEDLRAARELVGGRREAARGGRGAVREAVPSSAFVVGI